MAGAPPQALPPGFAGTVVNWQRRHGRHDLPWQGQADAYRLWVSEIMLQQTQVATVLRYYAAFLHRFPDVATLAAASLDDVLSAWAGLGYYRRARLLHEGARAVIQQHAGRVPVRAEVLAGLPGIGRSTAAAIAAFSNGERAPILDGNVMRVFTRMLAWDADVTRRAVEERLFVLAAAALPRRRADMPAYTQGLMDLGATVCKARSPHCGACPVRADCRAMALGRPTDFPVKSAPAPRTSRHNLWIWLEDPRGAIWLEQRPASGVWAHLWTLPILTGEADWRRLRQDWPALRGRRAQRLPAVEHALTHFDWILELLRLQAPDHAGPPPGRQGDWFSRADRARLALPAPLAKLLGATRP